MVSSLTITTWHRRFNHASVVLRAMGSLISICLIAVALVFASVSFTNANVEAAPTASITSNPTRVSGSDRYYIPGDSITTRLQTDLLFNTHDPGMKMKIDIGGVERQAGHTDPLSSGATDKMNFSYTVVWGDCDSDGITIPANSVIGSAWFIPGRIARPTNHSALTNQSAHKVFGCRPTISTTPSTLNESNLNNAEIVVTLTGGAQFVTGAAQKRFFALNTNIRNLEIDDVKGARNGDTTATLVLKFSGDANFSTLQTLGVTVSDIARTGPGIAGGLPTPTVNVAPNDEAPSFGSNTVANQYYTALSDFRAFTFPAAHGGNGNIRYIVQGLPSGLITDLTGSGTCPGSPSRPRTICGTPSPSLNFGTYNVTIIAQDADSNQALSDQGRLTFSINFSEASIASTNPASLTEETLDTATVNVALVGTTFGSGVTASDFELVTAIPNVSISQLSGAVANSNSAALRLDFSGDFNTPQTLAVKVKNSAHAGNFDLTTGTVNVAPTDEPPVFDRTVLPYYFDKKSTIRPFQIPAVVGGNGAISYEAHDLPAGIDFDEDGTGSCPGAMPRMVCGKLTGNDGSYDAYFIASDADTNEADSDKARLNVNMNFTEVDITATRPAVLTEANLNNAEIELTLEASTTFTSSNFELVTTIPNLTIASVSESVAGGSVVNLTLGFHGDITGSETLAVKVNATANSAGVDLTTDTVTVTPTPGIALSKNSIRVEEDSFGANANVDTYTVALNANPGNCSVIVVAESNSTDVEIDTDSTKQEKRLTFSSTNWSDPQTITVTAKQDADQVNDTVTLSHRNANQCTGSLYTTSLTFPSVSVEVVDDDAPGKAVLITSRPANGTHYVAGENITTRIRGLEAIATPTSFPTLQMKINIGGSEQNADVTSTFTQGMTQIDFSYTVTRNDFDTNGISIPANSLVNANFQTSSSQAVDTSHSALADQSRQKVVGSAVSISATNPTSLTETNLNNATLNLSLTGTTFASGVTASSFELVSAIPDLSISQVSTVNSGDTTATLTLAFTGSISAPEALAVKVKNAAHAGSVDLTSASVSVAPTDAMPVFTSIITTKILPKGIAIQPFQIPAASGGNGELSYEVRGLPAGLVFDEDGSGSCPGNSPRMICGTPRTAAINYSVRVTVNDADSDRARSDQARQEFIIALYGINIVSTTPSTLSELNLNTATIRVELVNTTFGRGVNASSFELVTELQNVSVNSVSGGSAGSRTATLSMYFGGTFSSASENLAVRVKSTAHRRSGNLTTDPLTVQGTPDVGLSVNTINLSEDNDPTATYIIFLTTSRAPGCDLTFDIESNNPDVRIGTASNSPTKIVGNFMSSQTYTVQLYARSDADHLDDTATITHKFKNSCVPYTTSMTLPSMQVRVVDDEDPPAVAISSPALLTRSTLNGATLNLALQNATFASGLVASGFELVTGIANLSISGVVASGTTATLTLSHSGTLSADRKLRVRVPASSHSGVGVLETNEIDVLLNNDTAPSFGSLVIPTKYFAKGVLIDPFTIPPARYGNGDLTYEIQGLPAGLDFDKIGGRCGPGVFSPLTICGTPTAAGTHTVTITVTDADSNSAGSDKHELTFTIFVSGVSITSSPAQLTRSNLNTATLSLTLTDTTFASGVSTSSFEVLTLIPDVTISQVSGATAGTTTATLTLAYTPGTLNNEQTLAVKVKANANTRGFDLTSNALTVQPPDIAPSFGSGSVTDKVYQKGQSITEFQIPVATHAGGDSLSYTVENLPRGLVFDKDGSGICPGNDLREICGTPAVSGSSSVNVVVNDEDTNRASGDQARLTFNITVYDAAITSFNPVSLTGTNLNSATLGITLTGTTFGSGVTASSFEFVTTIPSLSISNVSTVNSGDTTATLTLAFTGSITNATTLAVKVLAAAHARSGDLTTGSVLVPPTNTDDTAPSFGTSTVAAKYFAANTSIDAFQIPAASGGNGNLTYTVTNLPTGFVFDADGNGDCSGSNPRTVCGTPTATGSSTVTVNVHDADSNRANTDRAQISFMIMVSGASVVSTNPSSLTEANLNAATINLSLTGTTFGSVVPVSSFELVTDIPDVSIAGVSGVTSGGTTAALTLGFIGNISNAQTLAVKVLAAAHARDFDIETNSISVAASDEKPTFGGVVGNKDFATNSPILPFQIPAASGGNGDLTYTVTGLPSGIVFDKDGSGSCPGNTARAICGTPASDTTSVVVVTVHDSDSNRASGDSDVLMFKLTVGSPAAAITSTNPAQLTESNLNDATIEVRLSQTTLNRTYTAANFELVSTIPNLTIAGIRGFSNKIVRLQLGFTGEFDAAQTIAVKVKASAHAHSGDLTTGTITVNPTSELVLSKSRITLNEDPGESEANIGTYTVKLTSNPGNCDVVLEHISSNSDVTVGSGESFNEPSITFDSTNWNSPVTVRVTAAQDTDTLNDTATISYRNTRTCAGTLYPTSGEFPPRVTVVVIDDDIATATITSPAAFTTASLSAGQISISISNVAFGSGVSTSSFQLVTGITGLSISQVSNVNSGDTTATLTLSSFSGTITGTETLAVRVLNSAHTGNSDITSNALTVNSTDNAPSFGSATIANKNYQQNSEITAFQIPVATGGEGTLAYELESLPAGLIFDEDGTGDCDGSNVRTVCGTPTTAGSSTVVVNVHDADSNRTSADRAQNSFTITVSSVSITSTSQTPLTESDLGGATISVTLGGTSFGSGVTASSFGLVTEIPNVSIASIATVTSGDTTAVLTLAFTGNMSSSQTLGVSVQAAAHTSGIALTSEAILVLESSVTDSVPTFGSNTVSNRKFAKDTPIEAIQVPAATGGNGTLIYTATNLPEGLVFDADGTGSCQGTTPRTICGTPTAYGTSSVMITVNDSDSNRAAGDTISLTFSIEIAKPSVAIASTNPSPLTESGLNTATLTLQLTNSSFASPATLSNFELLTNIPSIGISQVSVPNPGRTTAVLTLTFTGNISTQHTLAVKVKDAAHASTLDLTSATVAVSPTDEVPSFSSVVQNKVFVVRTNIVPFRISTASGGNGRLSYEIENLPPGLVFDENGTGRCGAVLHICGRANGNGSFTVNVIANDADSNRETSDQARQTFTINVLDVLVRSTTPSSLTEADLNNAKIAVHLIGTTFASGVNASSFELVTAIPSLSILSVSGATAGGTEATLTLAFTGDISTAGTVAVRVKGAAHTSSNDALTTVTRGVFPTSGVAVSAQTLTLDEAPGDNTANVETYTIALKSSPGNCSVVIEASSNNADVALDADSSPLKQRFTFDGTSWNVPQTVTVTVSRDSDGFDETSKVTHAIVAQCAGTPYISTLDIPSVSVVVNDSESVAVESSPAFFTIDTFNNSDLTLNLTGTTFTKTLVASDFQLITNIEGISILSATGASGGSTATLRLGFRGVARSDSKFKVRILAAAHAGPDNLESGDISLLVADTAPSFGTSSVSNKYFMEDEPIATFQIPAVSGGNGTITYSVDGLPEGLVFDADGSVDCPHSAPRTICGTPTELDVSNIVVTVIDSDTNDSDGDRAQLMFDISIVEASVTSSPSQLVWSNLNNSTLSLTLTNTTFVAGVSASDFEVVSTLSGLSISGVSGVTSGGTTGTLTLSFNIRAIATLESFAIKVKPTAHAGDIDLITNAISVSPSDVAPTFGGATLSKMYFPAGNAITEFQIPAATHLTDEVSYTVQGLPAGLEFDEDGSGSCSGNDARKICGTPVAPGIYSATATAHDQDTNRSTGDSATLAIQIIVYGPTISSTSPSALLASNLNAATISLSMSSVNFVSGVTTSSFELITNIPNLSISQISGGGNGALTATLTLAFTGSITSAQTLAVRVKAAAHSRTGDITTPTVLVLPTGTSDTAPSFSSSSLTKEYSLGVPIDAFQIPAASGGNGDLDYTVVSVPQGIIYDADGSSGCPGTTPRTICGTLTRGGSNRVTVTVHDSDSNRTDSDRGQLSINMIAYRARIQSTNPSPLTVSNLNTATISVSMTGSTFGSGVTTSSFELITDIPSLSISQVSGATSGSSSATLTLSFSGNFSVDETLKVKIKSSAHARGNDLVSENAITVSPSNAIPTFSSTVDNKVYPTNVEIDAFQIPAASGGNGDLDYSVAGLPSGLMFDEDGNGDCPGTTPRTICGTPDSGAIGVIVVVAHDSDLNRAPSDSARLNFFIRTTPAKVRIVSTSPATLTEANLNNATIRVALELLEFESGANSSHFELVTEISNMSITQVSGVTTGGTTATLTLSFTGDFSVPKTLAVKLKAAAHNLENDVTSDPITVSPTDESPAFSESEEDKNYFRNVAITSFQVPAASGGNGSITYVDAGLPDGLVFDADGTGSCQGNEARTICGTPTTNGTSTVTITASDTDTNNAQADKATLTFMIRVQDAPTVTISSTPGTLSEDNLHRATIDVTLSGTVFAGSGNSRFELDTSISGLTISRVTGARPGSTTATLTLAFDQVTGNFNATQSLRVKVKDAGHLSVGDLTSNSLSVLQSNEVTISTSRIDLIANNPANSANSGSYTIVLASAPQGNVVLRLQLAKPGFNRAPTVADNITIDTNSMASGNQNTLTFTQMNWNTPQTVNVTGRDAIGVGATSVETIIHDITSGSAPYQTGQTIDDVKVWVHPPISIPAGLSAVAGDGQATLNWTNPSNRGIAGYELSYRAGTSGAFTLWTAIPGSNSKSIGYTVPNLTNGIVYTVRLRTVSSGGHSGYAETTVTPSATADAMPKFTKTVPRLRYKSNSAIATVTLPAATGGNGTLTYAMASVPTGLTYTAPSSGSNHGGTITGTPTQNRGATNYALTATDTDNDVATLNVSIEVLNAPYVTGLRIGSARNYLTGELISVVVQFNEDVSVTGGGTTFLLQIGDTWHRMDSVEADSDSNEYRFEYRVASTDWDGDGITVPRNPFRFFVEYGGQGSITRPGRGASLITDIDVHRKVSFSNNNVYRVNDKTPSFPAQAIGAQRYVTGQQANLILPAATSGDMPLHYVVDSSDLPDGLIHTPPTGSTTGGTISGTPTRVENKTVNLTATDRDGDSASLAFAMNVERESLPDFGTATSPHLAVEINAAANLALPQVSGGNLPVVYSVSPSLPDGLVLDSSTAAITGTSAIANSSASYRLTAVDYDGDTDTLDFTLAVTQPVRRVSAVSINSTPAANKTYAAGENITAAVRFDGDISVTGSPKLELKIGDATRQASFTSLSGANTLNFSYTVLSTDRDNNGISIGANALKLNGGTIGGVGSGAVAANLNLGTHAISNDANHKVQGGVSAPTHVTFVSTPANGDTYRAGETIITRVSFDQEVEVTGFPQLELKIGSRTRKANYSSRTSGNTGLNFTYTIIASDRDDNGISIDKNALQLNGGKIQGTGKVDALLDLGFSAVSNASGHKVAGGAAAPSQLTVTSSPASGDTYGIGETIEATVVFDEAITVTGSPKLALTIGENRRQATFTGRSNSNTAMNFSYTVLYSDLDDDGISIDANALIANGGTIRNSRNIDADLSLDGTAVSNDSNHKVAGGVSDNDPRISISSPSVTEGNGGSVTLRYAVTLSKTGTQQITVNYGTGAASTASAGTDYTLTPGMLTFAPGETSKNIDVTVQGDTLNELDEIVVVVLSNPTNAALAIATGTGTITDDDAIPTLSISSPSVVEGDRDNVTLQFVVTLSAASGRQVTVDYAEGSGGSANPVWDYDLLSEGTLTFAPGETRKTIDVTVKPDTADEADETIMVVLSDPSNATLSTATGTGTITDNDATPSLSISSPSVIEGDGGATTLRFVVTLSAVSGRQVTVRYAEGAGGTAIAGTDYTALVAGMLTFAPGESSRTIDVSVTGDTTEESNETIVVTLSSPTNATISTATGTGTITDDDGMPSLSIDSPTVVEGADGTTTTLRFTVTLSPANNTQRVTVKYADAGTGRATSGTDYVAINRGTLEFAVGETSKNINVTVNGDALDEPDEQFVIALSEAVSASISTANGTGTITDDDVPQLSISSPTVEEVDEDESATMEFTVTLSPASWQQVSVEYAEGTSGTATQGTDYLALTGGTLTFAPGDLSKSFTVTVTGDEVDEQNETVVVELSDPTNAGISTGTGTGTITDNDEEPTVTLHLIDNSISETGTAAVSASLSHASSVATTITITPVADLYTVGIDSKITIAAGRTANALDTATITAVNNNKDEDNRTGTVTGTAQNSVGIGSVTGVSITIEDDDDVPTLSINSPSVTEGDDGTSATLTFTVTLGALSGRAATVAYAESTGTATQGTDYTALAGGTLTFAAGETSKTIEVTVTGDDSDEVDETVLVVLSAPTNASIETGNGTGTGTITDDDDPPTVSIASQSSAEGDSGPGTAQLEVTLSVASGKEVTVAYAEGSGGTATQGTDYTALPSGMLTFAAGETAKDIDITVTGDTTQESDETVVVTLSSPVNATLGTASGTLTIQDDDASPVTVSISVEGVDGNGNSVDRDATWSGLQIREGDYVHVKVTVNDPLSSSSTLAASGTISCRLSRDESLGSWGRTNLDSNHLRTTSPIPQACSLTVPGTTSILVHKVIAAFWPRSDTTLKYTLNLDTDTIATNGGRIRKVVLGTSSVSAEVLDISDSAPTFGTGSVTDKTFTKDVPIAEFQIPEATEGEGTITYTVSGLPVGLIFDADGSGTCSGTEAREICGTPTTVAAASTVTITASDEDSTTGAADQATLTFDITVVGTEAV